MTDEEIICGWNPGHVTTTPHVDFPYLYSWGPRGNLPGALSRKGQHCALLARGSMNSALVQFPDGTLAVVSRNALRRRYPSPTP